MAVSNIKLFNNAMDSFFIELIDTFPEETKIKVEYLLFQTLCTANCKKIPTDFMNTIVPYLEKVAFKDSSFFIGNDRPKFLDRLNISKLWSSDLSIVTKDSIWKYIALFLNIGVKIINVPNESKILIDYIVFNS